MAYSPHRQHFLISTNLKSLQSCTKKYWFITTQLLTPPDTGLHVSELARSADCQTINYLVITREILMTSQRLAKFFVLFAGLTGATITYAADSVQNISAASTHASKAVTLGIAASGQATLGVMAVPMLSAGVVSGGVGGISTAAGNVSTAASGSSISGPLPITDETITVTSPIEAMKQQTLTTPR